MQYGALNGLSKPQSRLWSANGDRGVPIIVEENHRGGGMK